MKELPFFIHNARLKIKFQPNRNSRGDMSNTIRRIIAHDIRAIAGVYCSDAPHENSSAFDSCQKGEKALAEITELVPGRMPERPAIEITAKNAYR